MAVEVAVAPTEVGSGVLTSAVNERGLEPLSTEALKQSLEPLRCLRIVLEASCRKVELQRGLLRGTIARATVSSVSLFAA